MQQSLLDELDRHNKLIDIVTYHIKKIQCGLGWKCVWSRNTNHYWDNWAKGLALQQIVTLKESELEP